MKRIILAFSVVGLLMLSACTQTQHLGNLSALATGSYNPQRINSSTLVKKDAVGGVEKTIIFGILIDGYPKVDEAVADALRQNDGDFIKNASLYYKRTTMLFVVTYGFEVKGDVYKTEE